MTNNSSLTAINENGVSTSSGEVVAHGYVTAGPRYTGDICTGVWLRIVGRDPINAAIRRKGVGHVQLSSSGDSPNLFNATGTFDHRDVASYPIIDRHGQGPFESAHGRDFYVEVTDKHAPEPIWREVADKPAGFKLTLEATMSADGVLGMTVPTRMVL